MTGRQLCFTVGVAAVMLASTYLVSHLVRRMIAERPSIAPAQEIVAVVSRAPRPTMVTRPGAKPYGNDPSVEPDVLARAFAPPPANLPVSERPITRQLVPDPDEWQQLQRSTDALAF